MIMNKELQNIIKPIKGDVEKFNIKFYDSLNSNVAIINTLIKYIDPIFEKLELSNKVNFNSIYPNPFNPTVTVPFSIPYEMHTRVLVYNITGELVDVLLEDHALRPGYHSITWDGSRFSSGVYIIQIETPLRRYSQKAFLLK